MRVPALVAVLVVSSAAVGQDFGLDTADPAITQLRQRHGGNWVVQRHPATGTPSAIYGTGIPVANWQENSLAHAREAAGRVLEDHRELLGLGQSRFIESIGARMGRTWSFTFDQFHHGLPVLGGRADVRINMRGIVAMLGSRAWSIPDEFNPTPTLSAELATAIAWQHIERPPAQHRPANSGRLVIWGDTHSRVRAPVALAWQVPIRTRDRFGNAHPHSCYVDAHNGSVLEIRNERHECGTPGCTRVPRNLAPARVRPLVPVPTTITVMAWTNTGIDALEPLVNTPLAGVELHVPGAGTVTTDANGQVSVDITSPVAVTITAFDGRHHRPITGPSAPTRSFTVSPGVPTTLQLSSPAANPQQTAHSNVTYWVDLANEWCRDILGNTPQLATTSNITPRVNLTLTCNAYYQGNTINFFRAGGGCSNTAFSTFIVHEWGHGLDDHYGGISNSVGDGLSEGWGDTLAMYLVDSPEFGSGFQSANTPLRSGNNSKIYGTQSSVHDAGQVWMGFAWRYREQLRANHGTATAIQVSEATVIGSIVANATNQADAVREVFIADDDDGNLLNGVPHYAELSAAAIAKGIPFPNIQVATITHTPLSDTTAITTPRPVRAVMTPVSGNIVATRLHYDSGNGPLARNMHADGSPNGYVAMLPGQPNGLVRYHLEADHSTGPTVRLPAAGEFEYSIDDRSFRSFYTEDFEGGPASWTSGALAGTPDWQLGSPSGKSGTSGGLTWRDPTAAASGGSVYGTDLGSGAADGRHPHDVDEYLHSPLLDCTGRVGVRLRFKRWLSIEDGTYDRAILSVNGVPIWSNPTGTAIQDTTWQTFEYPIPMADNNPAVQVEWRLVSDGTVSLGGWQIDDVELGETIVPIPPASLTVLPEQATQGTTLTLNVTTPAGPRPYALAIGTTAGPTTLQGAPPIAVGGNLILLFGSTVGNGQASATFAAPWVPTMVGMLFHSQVITLDATLSSLIVSNPHINLFTRTP